MHIKEFLHLLKCPDCITSKIKLIDTHLILCQQCNRSFNILSDNIIQMLPSIKKPKPKIYEDQDYIKWLKNKDKLGEGTPGYLISV